MPVTTDWMPYHERHGRHHDRLWVLPDVGAPKLGLPRDVVAWIPPAADHGGGPYPVVYAFDGQNLFDGELAFSDTWQADRSTRELAAEGYPAILVGIANGGRQRLREYGPFVGGRRRGLADATLDLLDEAVIPAVESRFPARPEAAQRAVLGSSMGGLLALFAAFSRPGTWGLCAAFSPSLQVGSKRGWPFFQAAAKGPRRVYLDVGTREVSHPRRNFNSRHYSANATRLRDLLRRKGYRLRQSLVFLRETGAGHHESAWARRLKPALRWLLGGPVPEAARKSFRTTTTASTGQRLTTAMASSMAMDDGRRIAPALAVHGGAWNIPDELWPAHRRGCRRAWRLAWTILQEGGSSLDAVTAAIRDLEDDPVFDAGAGSFLDTEGRAALDAGLMEGRGLASGAVVGVTRIANPIDAARRVLEASPHCLLVGAGAESFAAQEGIVLVDPAGLVDDRERRRWQELKAGLRTLDESVWVAPRDTVGCLALDREGRLAAGNSTGGTPGKAPGRVGDAALIGSGFYADDEVGAVVCTGWGEPIMRSGMLRVALAEIGRLGPQGAAEAAVEHLARRVEGYGGVLVMSAQGEVGAAFNTARMALSLDGG